MELFKVDTIEDSIQKIYDKCIADNFNLEIEEISIDESLGRVLASDVVTSEGYPTFDRSVVDGYAVISNDVSGATETMPVFLEKIYEVKMGENVTNELKSGECIYVPTGGMIPKNADSVIMIEHTENLSDKKIAIYKNSQSGKNIVKKYSDIKKDETVIQKSEIINECHIGLLSVLGITQIPVYKKLNVTIISTGDELVPYDTQNILDGKIRDSNSNMIKSGCIKYGFNVVRKIHILDDFDSLNEAVKSAKNISDVILLSGGSSKGKKDFTKQVIEDNSRDGLLIHGISIKPGKPTIASYDSLSKTILIGLPGHSQAAYIVFKLLFLPLYEKFSGVNFNKNKSCMGKLTENIPSSQGRKTIQLVSVSDDFYVTPIYGKSGSTSDLANADGYIVIELNNEGFNKNDVVKVYYL